MPWWLTALVLLRDLVIVFGAIAYRCCSARSTASRPSRARSTRCARSLFCLAVVSQAAYGWPPQQAIITLGALVL